MAVFNFDDANCTSGLPAVWPLRMRVNRSATGSVMLIARPSPARLREAWNLAPEGDFADLHAGQSKFAIHAARAARDCATIPLARGTRVPGHRLQLRLCGGAVVRRRPRSPDQLFELSPLCRIPFYDLGATSLALDHARLRHSP